MTIFINGIITGLILQLAVGPVFFFLLGILLSSGYSNALFGIAAVTLVDFIYIFFSIIGIGKFLEKDKTKKIFGVISAIVLLIFGTLILKNSLSFNNLNISTVYKKWNSYKAFLSCFLLTLSSPLTIVFWSSIFVSKAIENNYKQTELVLFGFGSGSATFIFLSIVFCILNFIKKEIPISLITGLNIAVGLVIIMYGCIRILKFARRT